MYRNVVHSIFSKVHGTVAWKKQENDAKSKFSFCESFAVK